MSITYKLHNPKKLGQCETRLSLYYDVKGISIIKMTCKDPVYHQASKSSFVLAKKNQDLNPTPSTTPKAKFKRQFLKTQQQKALVPNFLGSVMDPQQTNWVNVYFSPTLYPIQNHTSCHLFNSHILFT